MAFLVTASETDRLQGFILASVDARGMMSVVLRAPHLFAAALLKVLVARPCLVLHALETVTYGAKTRSDVHAELIVIAVDPAVRSRGIGRRMLETLHRELADRAVRRYKVTVHASMADANRFYVENGFALETTFELYGVAWNLYVRAVD